MIQQPELLLYAKKGGKSDETAVKLDFLPSCMTSVDLSLIFVDVIQSQMDYWLSVLCIYSCTCTFCLIVAARLDLE